MGVVSPLWMSGNSSSGRNSTVAGSRLEARLSRNFSQLTQIGTPSDTMSMPICDRDWPLIRSVTVVSEASGLIPKSLPAAELARRTVFREDRTRRGVGRVERAASAIAADIGR